MPTKLIHVILVIIWALPISNTAAEDAQYYDIAQVLSGDTFQLTTGSIIQYAGIRAPSLLNPSKQIENLAEESLAFHRDFLSQARVRIEWGSRIRNEKGHYLAYVFLEDGTFANGKIVERGYAKLKLSPPNLEYADELRQAAQHARRQGRGLWQYEDEIVRTRHPYIGDKMTQKFHTPDCEILLKDVPQAHRKKFRSRVEALAAGYKPDNHCKSLDEQHTELY